MKERERLKVRRQGFDGSYLQVCVTAVPQKHAGGAADKRKYKDLCSSNNIAHLSGVTEAGKRKLRDRNWWLAICVIEIWRSAGSWWFMEWFHILVVM
ncbi:hypothetical protein E2542_SST13516 [Spatholobus suberectus]|nr:hypothetical protein E2542_SST13516 [Spatholobus suberectus]